MSQPTPLTWPNDLEFGTLVGRFVYLDGDSDDSGDEPDLIPAAGGTVEVEANAALAAYLGAAPLTAVKRKVIGIIDAEGYLCRRTASGMPGARGLSVVATDSEQLSTQGFNYKVTVKLPGATIPAMNLSVPGGTEVDLATAVTEAVSGGTRVVSLTPEIRAEIQRAASSVSIDTTGLATEVELAAALEDRVTTAELSTALEGHPDTAAVEQIVLENALLNEEQPLVSAAVVDGVLVLTRRDGVELTVEGGTAGASAATSWVWRLPWQSFAGGVNGGWLSREGQVVTLRAADPGVRNNAMLFNPPDGFKPVRSRSQDSLLWATGVTLDGTSVGGAAHFYSGTLYVDVPEAMRVMVDTGTTDPVTGEPILAEDAQTWQSLTVSWLTLDAAPAPAQTTNTNSAAPLQLAPPAGV